MIGCGLFELIGNCGGRKGSDVFSGGGCSRNSEVRNSG